MVQQKLICWICWNRKKYVNVTKLRHLLIMKTLETMFEGTDNTKQVHKDILPVCQHCTDIEFKPFLVLLNHILSFFPQVVRLWNSLPKDITNIQNKTNFNKKVEIF